MPTGENQANYRDSTLDILEELGDAIHIGELTEAKVARFNPELLSECGRQLNDFNEAVIKASKAILRLRRALPEFYAEDRIKPAIERACAVNHEGTEVAQNFRSELPEGESNETTVLP